MRNKNEAKKEKRPPAEMTEEQLRHGREFRDGLRRQGKPVVVWEGVFAELKETWNRSSQEDLPFMRADSLLGVLDALKPLLQEDWEFLCQKPSWDEVQFRQAMKYEHALEMVNQIFKSLTQLFDLFSEDKASSTTFGVN